MPASRYPKWRRLRINQPAHRLRHVCAGGIGRGLALDQTRREALVSTLKGDPLKGDHRIMDMQIDGAAEALDTFH